ncbi:MAG: WecB/TagA/CpsF family glycosyltransferase [Pseudomonadota bacterium]
MTAPDGGAWTASRNADLLQGARPVGRDAAAPLGRLDRLIARLPAAEEVSADETARLLRRAQGGRAGRAWTLAFVNAHAVNLCASSREALAAFDAADLVLRDGSGMAILMRWAGRRPGANANGTDLIPRLALAPGARVALYGARPGVAEAAAKELRARGGAPVAARHGFHPMEAYEAWIREDAAKGATLVVLGFGAPRQETLARRLRAAAPDGVGIVCGGAILDFMAGRVPRAPRWMRRIGVEWVWRLGLEPRRLFRRYVIGNPLFLWRARGIARRLRQAGGD